MSDVVSALGGARYDGLVRIEDAGLTGMITLRGDLASKPIEKALKDAVGCKLPAPNMIEGDQTGGVAWMSPDEVLILCPYAEVGATLNKVHAALGKAHALAENVSDARALLAVTGPSAREVMAKLCPVDLAPGQFEPGQFRRTRMAQVPAAFWMADESAFRVICFRSAADYAFTLLKTVSQPGAGVGVF